MALITKVKYTLKLIFFQFKDVVKKISNSDIIDHYFWQPNSNKIDLFETKTINHIINDKSSLSANPLNFSSSEFHKELFYKYSSGTHPFTIFRGEDVIVQSKFALATKDSFILASPFQYDILDETRYQAQKYNFKGNHYKDRDFLLYLKRPDFQTIEKAVVLSTSASNGNYSHFMIDLVPKFLYVLPTLDENDYLIINGPVKNFVTDFFSLFGYEDQLIIMDNHKAYKINECSIVGALSPRGNPTLEAINLLNSIKLTSLSEDSLRSHKVYISRRLAKARKMLNEVELEMQLMDSGFEIVFLEKLSIPSQIHLFKNAKVIVSPHGAGLTNLVFCETNTLVIEIFTSRHLESSMFNNAAIKGLIYNYIVFDSVNKRGDYIVKVPEIIDFLNIHDESKNV